MVDRPASSIGRAAWLKTLTGAVSTWLAVFVIAFLLLHLIPGSPADALDAAAMTPENVERTRAALGLDQPLPLRFFSTVVSYLRGELGVSFALKRPVARVLLESLPATASLAIPALLLSYPLGIAVAFSLVWRRGRWSRWGDRIALTMTVMPIFWLGVLLIYLFHFRWGWLPASHAASPEGSDWSDRIRHLVLPVLTLSLPAIAAIARYQTAALLAGDRDDHVRLARAKGLGSWRLAWPHRLRPVLAPAIALFGLDLPALVSGAVVVEVLFAWPGIGRLGVQAILGNDYPLALATTLLTATFVILGRLLAQQLARWNDPRERATQ